MNDLNNQKPNPFQPAPKKPVRSHANFIEALKTVGSSTTKSIKEDLVTGVAKDFVTSITGGTPQSAQENKSNWEQNHNSENQIRQEMLRAQRHKEVTETPLFNRKEEEAKARIKVIQDELKALAADLAGIDVQLQKAIQEEIVNPGAYHVSFFEKLRKIIIMLRKRVADSASWMETMTERGGKQQGYWGKVATSGTKFMLSQERYMATQAG